MDKVMIEHSLPYISGMGYRHKCDFTYDEFFKFNPTTIEQFDGMKIFVKTDFLDEFFINIIPRIKKKIILYTHNSDLLITEKYIGILENQHILKWYGQNIGFKHKKLESIPIGLANKRWKHGDINILEKIINESNKKDNIVYCNFDVNTNYKERKYCIDNIPYKMDTRRDYETYLRNISKSLFTISPNGNGVDCHKHWESLYLKTIPIVTESINISFYKKYPFLVLNDWKDLFNVDLNFSLYKKIWLNFDFEKLYI